MKIAFVTDLHGNPRRYEEILALACRNEVDAVLVGGDNLELDFSNLGATESKQRLFLREFLDPHLEEYDKKDIHWISILSSHDLPVLDQEFDRICDSHLCAHHISRKKTMIGGYEFIGFDLVADYPFPPKSRARRDDDRFRAPPFRGKAIEATSSGWEVVDDWPGRLQALPSLEQELEKLPTPVVPERAVYLIHHPPAGLGLGVLSSEMDIGSLAVSRFLEKVRPRFSLHGHVHESPAQSGTWYARIGETICIQPGQGEDRLQAVILDLETREGMLMGADGLKLVSKTLR